MNIIFFGTVQDGRFIPADEKEYRRCLLSLEGKAIRVTIGGARKARTTEQNKYYFGVVVDMVREATRINSKEETHTALRYKFLLDLSSPLPRARSTAELTVAEMTDYIENVRQWAAEFLNVNIPSPDEVET